MDRRFYRCSIEDCEEKYFGKGLCEKHDREKKTRYRRKQYNLTEQHDQRFAEQNGHCAICDRHQSEFGYLLGIDHDHTCCSGEGSCGKCVRGLLCNACNHLLTALEDKNFYTKATAYLQSFKITLKTSYNPHHSELYLSTS